MHRTLKAETTRPPAFESRGQQKLFDAFRKEYNEDRPHEALGQRPPARLYKASSRAYPSSIAEVEYPGHYQVREVGPGGVFSWRSKKVFVSHNLIGERVGMLEIEDGLWKVWFADLELGVFNEVEWAGRVLPMSPV